jgi:hypothetical protein
MIFPGHASAKSVSGAARAAFFFVFRHWQERQRRGNPNPRERLDCFAEFIIRPANSG